MNTFLTLIMAIIAVESNGKIDAIGDDGLAFGVLQIHAAYAQDAAEYAKADWTHNDAFNPQIAHQMFLAYMKRYATEKRLGRIATAEDIARIHNGGLNGYKKNATQKYWVKVQAELRRMGAHDLADGKVGFQL